ncbi:diguanylate cyclase domain-containing protein [Isachenkonia alkalipeptolytica]|uniref:Diguanylate cyclase n=1 Tax=Isachenkonia alkalipeptolytica TaxID=2565777 RepID=A0AA43XIU4_9CLOT|nr:diguanylate cyclase [Isachenkonia alkalipeptolytica]NBG87124.1 diguanylate cyclase [Isachenkonia alkalipeptolytica]
MSKLLEKYKKLLIEAKKLERINPKEGALLAEEVRSFAKEHNHEILESEALLRIGRCSYLKGDLEAASGILNEGLLLVDGLGAKEVECEMNLSMGNTYYFMEIHDQAVSYYTKALDISRKENLIHLEAGILNNIAAIFYSLEDMEDSLEYIKSGMGRQKEGSDAFLETSFAYNLAELYYRNAQMTEARSQIDRTMEMIDGNKDRLLYAKVLHILGLIENEEGKKESCFTHLEMALEISIETKEFLMEMELRLDLAECLIKEKKTDRSIRILQEAVEKNTKNEFGTAMLKIYRKLAEYYDLRGEQESANYYYRKHLLTLQGIEEEKKRERVRGIKLHLKLKQYKDETELYKNLSSKLQEKTGLLSDSYKQMQIVSEIGQKITAKLDIESIFEDLYKDMSRLMKLNTLGIGIYDRKTCSIKYSLSMEDGEIMPVHRINLENPSSLAAYSVNQDQELIINDMEKEYHQYVNKRSSSVGKPSKSAVFIPLKVKEKLIGVLTVQSREINSYSDKSLMALNTLASYIAIAINNAQKSQDLKKEIQNKERAQKSLQVLNKKLKKLSNKDGLTKVANRRYLDYQLEKDWQKALKHAQKISLLLLDIDYFKEYNDFYGHLKGDEVLKKIAEILTRTLEEEVLEDTVARYGGDEFMVVLPEADLEKGKKIADKVMREMKKEEIQHEESPLLNRVSLSIGIATVIPEGNNHTCLINKADQALYKAKRNGRNRIGAIG